MAHPMQHYGERKPPEIELLRINYEHPSYSPILDDWIERGVLVPVELDRQAIRDTLIENDGLSYDTVTDRIIELLAVGEETP